MPIPSIAAESLGSLAFLWGKSAAHGEKAPAGWKSSVSTKACCG
jgi:hypothetical protein